MIVVSLYRISYEASSKTRVTENLAFQSTRFSASKKPIYKKSTANPADKIATPLQKPRRSWKHPPVGRKRNVERSVQTFATLAKRESLRYGIDSRWQFKLEFTAFGDRCSLPLYHPCPTPSWVARIPLVQSKKSNDPSVQGRFVSLLRDCLWPGWMERELGEEGKQEKIHRVS